MKPKLKPPGTKCLKLKCDIPLSTSAFKFNLRRYIKGWANLAMRAYPEVQVDTCHSYQIHQPYKYRCTQSWCAQVGPATVSSL